MRSVFVIAFLTCAAQAGEIELVLQDGRDGYRGTRDTAISVDPRLADRNVGGEPTIWIWQFDGASLIKFSLDDVVIPKDAVVKQATLELCCTSVGFADEEVQRPWDVGVYEFLADWREGSGDAKTDLRDGATLKTWNGRDGWPKGSATALAGKLLGTTTLQGPEPRWYKWSLDPALVTSWIAGRRANHGFLVWGKAPGKAVSFASREDKSVSQRPALRLRLAGIDGKPPLNLVQQGFDLDRHEPTLIVGCWYHPFWSLKHGDINPHWGDVRQWRRHFPAGGAYDCEDPAVIKRQVEQMRDCGISFLVFDDTNCVLVDEGQIDRRIKTWFDWMDKRPEKERILLAIAPGGELNVHNNRQAWLDSVTYLYEHYASRPSYARLDGKPLLFWYIDKDSWPDWSDEQWTIRKTYAGHRPESKSGFAWAVRGMPLPNKEAMSVTTSWSRPDSPDVFPRNNGEYYKRMWLEVLRHQPRYVLISSWNEFAENVSIEDTTEYGSQYRTLTKGYVAAARHQALDGFVYTIEGTRDSNKRVNGRWRRTTPPRGAKTNIVIPSGHFPDWPR